eukprot:c10372_g1_i1.p1 GENE.c10372_g1_i1~~c10372_g1_i1.p1  ORF type:complete len:514 (-),score=102.25 c10372_g1_i1:18-1559(-)
MGRIRGRMLTFRSQKAPLIPNQRFPTKSGYLIKRGGRRKNWKKRFFVLDQGELVYKKSEQDTARLGRVPLDLNWGARECFFANKSFPFIIENPYGGRSYYCDASSGTERTEWVAAINKTISLMGGVGIFDQTVDEATDQMRAHLVEDITLPPTPAVTLNDFEIHGVLGKGMFGTVALVCRKGVPDKSYAMKVLQKEAIIAGNHVTHVKNERRILQQLHSPFLVSLHFAFQSNGRLYLILDYVPGGHLFSRLQNQAALPEGQVRLYAAELVLALQHLHGRGIVYRNLKPENILLDADGHVVLTGFGLSKEAAMIWRARSLQTVQGSEYFAPEIILDFDHNQAVDCWNLGVLIFEMLTGYHPFCDPSTHEGGSGRMSVGSVRDERDTSTRASSHDDHSPDDPHTQAVQLRILDASVSFPPHLGSEAVNLMSGLLLRDPDQRMSLPDVKGHPFFSGLDWDKVGRKEYTPEYVPFPAQLLPCDDLGPDNPGNDVSHFPGFSFVSSFYRKPSLDSDSN